MAKQQQTVRNKQKLKKPPRGKLVELARIQARRPAQISFELELGVGEKTLSQTQNSNSKLVLLPEEFISAVDSSAVEAQAAQLSDPRLQSAQRQALAARIGRVQGNQHLQRVMAVVNGHEQTAPVAKEASPAGSGVDRAVIQRDIINNDADGKVPCGTFRINMTKFEDPAGKSGEKGTVKFTPNRKGPNSASIRLSQIVKVLDLGTGADFDWSGSTEANRNLMRTTATDLTHKTKAGDKLSSLAMKYYGDPSRHAEIYNANKALLSSSDPNSEIPANLSLTIPGAVEGGYFIDHLTADPRAKPRKKSTDPAVPQDYVWPGEEGLNNKHGSKKGKKIDPASLYDEPGVDGNLSFNFETVARSEDVGIYYGTIHWDFKVNNHKVSAESYKVTPGVSQTFKAALHEFNKFYGNSHTVMKGETLSSIAQKYYGDQNKWPKIHMANKDKIADPNHIEPGWQLHIPGFSSQATTFLPSSPHTVAKGETLKGISKHYYGAEDNWRDIYSANTDIIKDPDVIHTGWQLQLPVL